MARAKADTISAKGLEEFLTDHYGPKAYALLVEQLTSGKPDTVIARLFSEQFRPVTYQNVGNWRRAYLSENENA